MRLSHLLWFDAQNNSCCNGHTHITDSESAELWEFLCNLDNEGASRSDGTNCCIACFKECWVLFLNLSGTWVQLFVKFSEHTCSLRGVAVEHRGVSYGEDRRVLEHDDLCGELVSNGRWVVDWTTDIAAANIVLSNTTNVETNVVSWKCFCELFVVHLDGFYFSNDVCRHEGDLLSFLKDTGLDTTYWHSSDTGNRVDILDWESERFVGRHFWHGEQIDRCKKCWALYQGVFADATLMLSPTNALIGMNGVLAGLYPTDMMSLVILSFAFVGTSLRRTLLHPSC